MNLRKLKQFSVAHPEGGHFTVFRWGPSAKAPPILLHHATGFSARTWEVIAQGLSSDHRVYAFDARGHGTTTVPPRTPSWELYGSDLTWLAREVAKLEGFENFKLGIGHSLGGTSMMISSSEAPSLLPKLAVIEPVVLPAGEKGGRSRFSMRTRMRRAVFPSLVEARRILSEDPSYKNWDRRTLAAFVESAFHVDADGSATLCCSPELEAKIYELGSTPEWSNDLPGRTSVLFSDSSRFLLGYTWLLQAGSKASSKPIGHLAPMEQPNLVGRWIREQFI